MGTDSSATASFKCRSGPDAPRPISRLAQASTPRPDTQLFGRSLSQYAQEAARLHIERIYADVPDQPLPVNTLTHVGYRTYSRQTIWRLSAQGVEDYTRGNNVEIRPQVKADEWALKQFYRRIVPEAIPISRGHGVLGDAASADSGLVAWRRHSTYLLVERGEVRARFRSHRAETAIGFSSGLTISIPTRPLFTNCCASR